METIHSNYSPTFLYIDKYKFSNQWVYQENNIPYSLLRYIFQGTATFVINDISYEVKANDVCYIPQGAAMACTAHEEITFISVRFTSSVLMPDTDILKKLWNIGQLYHFEEENEIKHWFKRMYEAALTRNTYRRMETRGYLNLICAALAELSVETKDIEDEFKRAKRREQELVESYYDINQIKQRAWVSYQKNDPRIRTLVDYITLNPGKNLSREEMSEMCGVGVSTLRRIFKQQMGKTIYEFVRDTKMMLAVHLLVTTNAPVSDIGYKLGYESPSYFTKSFRENFGVSPQEYRKMSYET